MRQPHNKGRRMTHYRLTPELIELACKAVAMGGSREAVAAVCRIHPGTLTAWLSRGRQGTGSELEQRLYERTQGALAIGELTLLQKINAAADAGDTQSARWLLTHSPAWRRHWAEQGPVRRAVQRTLAVVVDAIEAAETLRPEQRLELLQRIAAAHAQGAPDGEG